MNKTKRESFTLIELLVVISIILLLAALLMPAYRAVMESGRTSKCESNLRQIGAAMFLFAQDNNGCFPEAGSPLSWGAVDTGELGTNQPAWMVQLGPYISGTNDPKLQGQSGSIFTCPSSSLLSGSYPFDRYYSYFYSAHAAYAVHRQVAPVRRTAIAMPAEQILSGDVTDWPATNGVNDADKVDNNQKTIDLRSSFHGGAVNILYADGHVAAAGWNPTPGMGYFDPTRMATHYPGVIDPSTGQYYTDYLTP